MKYSFVSCGAGARRMSNKLGNNSAFVESEVDYTRNMLLVDCGIKAFRRIKKEQTLDGVQRLILFLTHAHNDHIGGVNELYNECQRLGIDFCMLLPPYEHERKTILSYLKKLNVPMDKTPTLMPSEVADLMDLRDIDFARLHHVKPFDTVALITKKKKPSERMRIKTVFATDHHDSDFIKSIIKDEQLEDLYTDCTQKPALVNTPHMPFETLLDIVPNDTKLRQRITLMHMTPAIPSLGKLHGFNTADELEYHRNDPYRYSRVIGVSNPIHLKRAIENKEELSALPEDIVNNYLNSCK